MRSNVTVDLGLRWEYYTPLAGSKGRAPGQLRSRDPHDPRLRLRRSGQSAQREEELQELLAAHRRVVAPQREDGRPRRLRREHDSVPRQPLRVQLSGEAELRGDRGRTGSSAPVRWPPASRRRRCSTFRRPASFRSAVALQNATLRRHPEHAPRGHAPVVERRLPAAAAVPADGRRRLRRQPRRRPRDGRRHQRQPGLQLRQQRPAGVLASVPAHRHQPHPHQLEQVAPTTGCR